jgi:WXG100 family type VII secretion target
MSYDDGQLVVNFARLQQTSGHIHSAIGALTTQLDQLERDAAPLVQAWSGDAKQAYLERQQIWRRASGELATMLSDIKRALDESIADYQATEVRNTNLFR